MPPEAARRSSCRSPSIPRARIVAITSSASSAGCVRASRWIAHATRCAASPPPWSRSFPPRTQDWGVRLETLYDTMLEERVRPSLLVLLAAVGMVLLIACANVANVLLARGISRQREFALRTALGAGRSRLVRQLVTESVCLAVVSGACGLLLAVFAVQTLRVMLPPTLPRIDEISVDATVLGARPAPVARERPLHGVGASRARVARRSGAVTRRSRARGSPVPSRTLVATRHRRRADGSRDDAARGRGAAAAKFRPAAAGPPRVRRRKASSPRGSRCPAPSIPMPRARRASGAGCWNRSTACHRSSPWRSASRRRSRQACARAAGRGTMPRRLSRRMRGSRRWSTW